MAKPENPGSLAREFWGHQAPLIIALLALAYMAAYAQHGFLSGGDRAFPLAGVRVPVWHLVWMGAWTGYTMALVGQAAGIFALPYSTSILQFSNPHVTPTMLVLTFLNPLGALLGFKRSGQWNLDLTLWVSLGGIAGGMAGPFLRSTVLTAPGPFQLTLGIVLALFGAHLCYAVVLHRAPSHGRYAGNSLDAPSKEIEVADTFALRNDHRFSIDTISKQNGRLTIGYLNQIRTLDERVLFVIGALVGVVSAALGVGGGFLLVPIFAAVYKLPMYIMVAATIPYSIVLSATGLFTYGVILPAFGTPAIQPEWAWGLFAAAGGVFGSWFAAKTQLFVPEHFLKLMLGGVTGTIGALYVINFLFPLLFHV